MKPFSYQRASDVASACASATQPMLHTSLRLAGARLPDRSPRFTAKP